MKVLIGTKNPGKIEGAKKAFSKYFENIDIEGVSVKSEVGNQPFNKEIIKGAKNRIKNVKKYAEENKIEADYYIASEAGITNLLGENDEYIDINVAIIEDKNGEQSIGFSQGFEIPNKYIGRIKESELGKVMDEIWSKEGLNKGNGGISHLTKNVVTRIDLTENAFIMALIKYINGDIWK